MIRLTLIWLFVGFIGIYAWKDWYKALCGLILLMAVIEHPDMPKGLWGIQGLNPWNMLLFIVLFAWWASRGRERLRWDMPDKVSLLFFVYGVVIIVAFARMMGDRNNLEEYALLCGAKMPTSAALVSEHIINTFKWVVPGLLLFDGCRSRERFLWGLGVTLLIYFLLAVQVIKWMPLGNITGAASLESRSLKILIREVGYHRVNLSMMLAGASWAIFASRSLAPTPGKKKMLLLGSFLVLFGQALTGGRAGYVTWAIVGVILCWVRWKRLLLLAPVAVVVVLTVVPAARDRLMEGIDPATYRESSRFEEMGYEHEEGPDFYTVTAGRNIAWPFVMAEILKQPWFGYGKEAMIRTGVASNLLTEFTEIFPHPHNAYLQLVFDNGIIGAFPVLLFFVLVVKYGLQLFKDSRKPEFIASGGAALALVLALLVASVGSQTFYPREGAVGMWCAIGLMLRVYVQRSYFMTKSDEINLWKTI